MLDRTTACRRCAGDVRESHKTVPYIIPGPCVVELRNVLVRRCVRCGQIAIDVPDAVTLDVVGRCLRADRSTAMPQLVYEDGRWCISDESRECRGGLSE